MKDQNILKKEKEIVLARLEMTSPELHFSIGTDGQNLSRDEMIAQINNNSDIGNDFVKVELEFLRSFKNGLLTKTLITA